VARGEVAHALAKILVTTVTRNSCFI
jgi:hypothetical protein